MLTSLDSQTELTPPCALGFTDRLSVLLNYIGVHKSGFLSFLVDATGLSQSGARRILTDNRPPKRLKAFSALASALATKVTSKAGQAVTTDQVSEYLLEDRAIDVLNPSDSFDIAPFLDLDPVKTSQIIIKIEAIANEDRRPEEHISSENMRLIRYRIINFCFKNDADHESEKVSALIRNLLELAAQNLL